MAEIIINIILAVLSVAMTYIAFYFDTKRRVQEQVNNKIDMAEDTGEAGAAKMEMVVNSLYKIVPAILKPFLTKAVIQKIAQKAFDEIEKYAERQAKKGV